MIADPKTLKYTCGHESTRAYNRRGKARLAIIADVESSSCYNCMLRDFARKLTRIDGTPYTRAEQAAFVAKRIKHVI